jgi:protein-glucosylgalactosylhydroxylysine glucosidase
MMSPPALSLVFGLLLTITTTAQPIDRLALVKRHNPTATKIDPLSPFTVGNGEFAFTADFTGLQTFPEPYDAGIPLHTQSQWGWHSFPNDKGHQLADALKYYDVHGRQVPYARGDGGPATLYLRENPHRLDLGRIGLTLSKNDGEAAAPGDLTETRQTLNLWSGILTSEFKFAGEFVRVRTACHPELDLLAVELESPLIKTGRLGVSISFPGAKGGWKENTDWENPEAHQSLLSEGESANTALISRSQDTSSYQVRAMWSPGARLQETATHHFKLTASVGERLWLVSSFSPRETTFPLPDAADVFQASSAHWEKFWRSGAAIDLSGSPDPRATELERRIVLSQYLTAIQCSGSIPPQETGLTLNSWFGKPHTEMHWWHAAQFALWGRVHLLERSLPWYHKILPAARELAAKQGYIGARWPKMVGPNGEESPSEIAGFLIWQQAHPIYYAELCYRAHPQAGSREVLDRYKQLVFETAEFMASYAWWNEELQSYELGPALIPAQECYDPAVTMNPTFELAYWQWALGIAQQWRERTGMKREPEWDKIIAKLRRPTVREGIYTAVSTEPFTETRDHFSMLAGLGFLPRTPMIDPETMSLTLDRVKESWNWESTWGWDYPLMAMTAARLGRPDDAVDALLMEVQKNTYLPNGHNYQDQRLPIYLPGNGGLLAAVALMAGGWDGATGKDAPGFPKNGKWRVRSEGLLPMP